MSRQNGIRHERLSQCATLLFPSRLVLRPFLCESDTMAPDLVHRDNVLTDRLVETLVAKLRRR
jgi:hypothetical protein